MSSGCGGALQLLLGPHTLLQYRGNRGGIAADGQVLQSALCLLLHRTVAGSSGHSRATRGGGGGRRDQTSRSGAY